MSEQLERGGADPLTLRRQDLAARVATYRQKNRDRRAWAGVAVGLGGLLASTLLITIADIRGWPDVLHPIFLAGGWVILLVSFSVVWRRERQLRARYQISCPQCAEPLLDATLGRAGVSNAELAIATGTCPHCGASILSA